MEAKAYFRDRGSGLPPALRGSYNRIANALHRGGVDTMDQLCTMSEAELARVRNIGAGTLPIVLEERKHWRARPTGRKGGEAG